MKLGFLPSQHEPMPLMVTLADVREVLREIRAIQTAEAYFAARRGLGDRQAALAFLSRPGGEAPRPGDELP